jgi:phospholipid/cholesterol/gamma-HCH transport system substrate-binding protein
MRRNVIETITGGVVLAAAIAFVVFAYSRSSVSQVDGYEVTVEFTRTDSLANGSEVRLGGIKIGTVLDQRLDPSNYRAIVRLAIARDIKLPTDSSARIQSDGLLGNSYVALEPGADDSYIEDGGQVSYSQAPINLADLLGRLVLGVAEEKTKSSQPDGSTGSAPDIPSISDPAEPAASDTQP